MTPRGQKERAVDLILELAALDRAALDRPAKIGATVLHKILFWIKYRLRPQMIAVPALRYRRHNFGPFSDDLVEDVALLRKFGHVDRANFRLTPRGKQLAQHWRALLADRNGDVFRTMDTTVDELATLTAAEVMERTYGLPSTTVGADAKYGTMRGIPKGVLLLFSALRDGRRFEIEDSLVSDFIADVQTTAQEIEDSKRIATPTPEDLRDTLGDLP